MPLQIETTPSGNPNSKALGRAILIVALFWLGSSQGYYMLVAARGLDSGYNDAPLFFACYYLVWTAASIWVFRSLISSRLNRARMTHEGLMMLPILAAYALFVVYGLPLLPDVSELRAPSEPPEFMFASAWYYLPKSADIVFQQTLAAALIMTADRAGYSVKTIAIALALGFGGFHLLLAFDGFTATYVTRFTLSGIVLGAWLPYIYLHTNHGFRWAFSVHWGFYAIDAILTHLILAAPPWAQT